MANTISNNGIATTLLQLVKAASKFSDTAVPAQQPTMARDSFKPSKGSTARAQAREDLAALAAQASQTRDPGKLFQIDAEAKLVGVDPQPRTALQKQAMENIKSLVAQAAQTRDPGKLNQIRMEVEQTIADVNAASRLKGK